MESENNEHSRVRVVKCSGWDDFKKRVRVCPREDGTGCNTTERIFRGHSYDHFKLSSVWERQLTQIKRYADGPKGWTFSRRQHERDLVKYIERFKHHSVGLPGVNTTHLTEVDWWALGRHHGLVTPLLDWTKSPYIAVFFAVMDAINMLSSGEVNIIASENFVVFGLLAEKQGLFREGEFELAMSRVDQASRQKAQQGMFTLLRADNHIDIEDYLEARGLGWTLTRYEVPKRDTIEILVDLNFMNINHAAVFPDLEGAAMQANIDPYNYGLFGALTANGPITSATMLSSNWVTACDDTPTVASRKSLTYEQDGDLHP